MNRENETARETCELDHIFLFVKNEAEARAMMQRSGLSVSYARTHPGQGTSNLCACVDSFYLELLWLDGSPVAASTEAISLAARGRGAGCPIGIAWRGGANFDCVDYAAPFLPAGETIQVARRSLDPLMPFIFRSPPPRPATGRAPALPSKDARQRQWRLGRCELVLRHADDAASLLEAFPALSVREGTPALACDVVGPNGRLEFNFHWTV